jgi:flagella basal body P-ring formation protein FlgA
MKPTGLLILFLVGAGGSLVRADTAQPADSPADFAVSRGQSVVLVATAEGIRLSAPGRALKEGKKGETIPVINTATRRPLKGIVREGWVEIPSNEEPAP